MFDLLNLVGDMSRRYPQQFQEACSSCLCLISGNRLALRSNVRPFAPKDKIVAVTTDGGVWQWLDKKGYWNTFCHEATEVIEKARRNKCKQIVVTHHNKQRHWLGDRRYQVKVRTHEMPSLPGDETPDPTRELTLAI